MVILVWLAVVLAAFMFGVVLGGMLHQKLSEWGHEAQKHDPKTGVRWWEVPK